MYRFVNSRVIKQKVLGSRLIYNYLNGVNEKGQEIQTSFDLSAYL